MGSSRLRCHVGVGDSVDLDALVGRLRAEHPELRELTLLFDDAGAPHGNGRGNGSVLTPREREVLRLVGQGFTNVRISHLLWITPDTVKFHLRNASHKLGVHGRLEAFETAEERGLLASPRGGTAPRPRS